MVRCVVAPRCFGPDPARWRLAHALALDVPLRATGTGGALLLDGRDTALVRIPIVDCAVDGLSCRRTALLRPKPHGEWGGAIPLESERAAVGVLIAPCVSQSLAPPLSAARDDSGGGQHDGGGNDRGGGLELAFPLVRGEAAVGALLALRPRHFVPLANGAVDATGLAAPFVRAGAPTVCERAMPGGAALVRAPLGVPVRVQ